MLSVSKTPGELQAQRAKVGYGIVAGPSTMADTMKAYELLQGSP